MTDTPAEALKAGELLRMLPAQPTEWMLLSFMYALHGNVPEDDRPMARCAFSDEQWARVEAGYAAMIAALPSPATDAGEVREREEELWVTVDRIETVTGDFMQEEGEPIWRIEIDGFCVDFDYSEAANNVALAINARISRALSPQAPSPSEGDGWEPIETAPRSAGRILVTTENGDLDFACWHRDHWCGEGEGEVPFTHWLPLPAPPAAAIRRLGE